VEVRVRRGEPYGWQDGGVVGIVGYGGRQDNILYENTKTPKKEYGIIPL